MSYARFSEGDVYVLRTGRKIECITKGRKIYKTNSPKRMYNHLKSLKKQGKKVPQRAFTRLKEEAKL
jgi:hypothetical protein